MMVNRQRLRIYSWRHSHGDHMLVNPVSVLILEWTLCYVMFCVILFRVCSRLTSRHVTCQDNAHSACPANRNLCSPFTPPPYVVVFCAGGRERQGQRGEGGAGEAERRAVRRGGGSQTAQETWEDPQVHRHNNTHHWFPLRPNMGESGLMNNLRNWFQQHSWKYMSQYANVFSRFMKMNVTARIQYFPTVFSHLASTHYTEWG